MGLARSERVAVYLDKRFETVIACFGAAAAGGVFVPVNPLLKSEQVGHILRDCNARVLVTSAERLTLLEAALGACPDLRHVIVVDEGVDAQAPAPYSVHRWSQVLQAPPRDGHRVIDTDMAAILYTSGSTGKPKGVVLSHRNMVAGAISVAQYLENNSGDTLLAVLPLSFDAGFSQLTTAFHAGARVVLLNYLLPKDVINALVKERVTGLTAVPPLYIQLARMPWPGSITGHLRYFANTGGRMPLEVLKALRERVPKARPFLMYGLTEAFRSTYLPEEDRSARIRSARRFRMPRSWSCAKTAHRARNEPGELVHRGALVAMGYWNDGKDRGALQPLPGREPGLVLPEIGVFSGDTVARTTKAICTSWEGAMR
jgi:acyl-CoA synthetase (AMP-forming)/AMP-acid ligase II